MKGPSRKICFFVVIRDNVCLGANIPAEIFELARKRNRNLTWIRLARHPMLMRLDDIARASGVEDTVLTASVSDSCTRLPRFFGN